MAGYLGERKSLYPKEYVKGLVDVYGEIASIRMRKIREFVLTNRDFLGVINDIFYDVLNSYAHKVSSLVKKGKMKEGGKVTFLAHNGKTVAVFISANTGFYGDVVAKTFKKFINDIRGQDVEVTIIGKLGLSMFLTVNPDRPYTYFDLQDYGIDKEKLSEVIRHLVEYDEIRVYYGQFESVIKQSANMFSIAAGAPVLETRLSSPKVGYIFEPTLEDILVFFETQIFASLFDQSIRESQLAKFASRIVAMDAAGENIKRALKENKLEFMRVKHRVENRKQLNTLNSTLLRQSLAYRQSIA